MRYLTDFTRRGASLINFYQHQDSAIFWSTCVSVFFSLFIIIIWVINLPSLPPQIPLFYSLPWGEAQLVNLNQFIILPSTIILITLLNLIISWHLHPSQIIIKRVLSLSSTLTSSLIFIAAIRIIYTFV